MRYLLVCVVLVAVCVSGCQRIHTETAGGGKASSQPEYTEKMQKPDPNLPGTSQ